MSLVFDIRAGSQLVGAPPADWPSVVSILDADSDALRPGPTDAVPPPSPGRLDSLDRALSRRAAIGWPHPRWFTWPLSGLSLAANYGVLWYALCLLPWLFGASEPVWKALYVAVPVTLVEMTGFVIKQFVGRARPPIADPSQPEQIPLPLSKSFPSSHASMSVVGTLTLGTLYPQWIPCSSP